MAGAGVAWKFPVVASAGGGYRGKSRCLEPVGYLVASQSVRLFDEFLAVPVGVGSDHLLS